MPLFLLNELGLMQRYPHCWVAATAPHRQNIQRFNWQSLLEVDISLGESDVEILNPCFAKGLVCTAL